MTDPEEEDALVKGVRLRRERRQHWMGEGDPSVARRLAQIGVLGWIIVVPMLIGVFAGRYPSLAGTPAQASGRAASRREAHAAGRIGAARPLAHSADLRPR